MSDDIDTKIENTTTNDTASDHDVADRHSDDSRERSESVRSSIKSAWREVAGEEPEDREDRRTAKKDAAQREREERRSWKPKGRGADLAIEAAAAEAQQKDPNKQAADAGASAKTAGYDTTEAPKSWRADEKAHYDALPPQIKNAVHRREAEMARGVQELKDRSAKMDAVMAPHLNTIRAYGHEPHQAVHQFWEWFKALGERPHVAFPALAKSFGHDMSIYGGGQQQQQQQYAAQQQAQQAQIDPQLYSYLQSVESRLGGIQQANQEQMMAQTHQVLADFAKGRPHFERVRKRMGELLQPDAQGRSIISLTPEGHVNLSAAYDMALRLDDELNEQMIAERIAQEKKAASDAAKKARMASSSLGPNSPGSNNSFGRSKQKPGSKSVRESLQDAISEARGSGKY